MLAFKFSEQPDFRSVADKTGVSVRTSQGDTHRFVRVRMTIETNLHFPIVMIFPWIKMALAAGGDGLLNFRWVANMAADA